MLEFAYLPAPVKAVFGRGALSRLRDEVASLSASRALVFSTPGQRSLAKVAEVVLGSLAVGVFAEAKMHVPVDLVGRASDFASTKSADLLVAIGGGSTIGLAKAVALQTGLPIVAVPTTYSGSEMTSIFGMTEGGVKRTGRDVRVLPKLVLYDPELTMKLPQATSFTSGMNAIAHAAEALYAPDGNPMITAIAEEGVRAMAHGLDGLLRDPESLSAREECLYAGWLCGTVLGAVSMALHHKLCHTLGGTFDLPHAETHTVILPYAMAYNAGSRPEAMARLARALGAEEPASSLRQLSARLGCPMSLRELGMPEDGIDRAVELTLSNPYWNPAPLEAHRLRSLIQRAWAGEEPESVQPRGQA